MGEGWPALGTERLPGRTVDLERCDVGRHGEGLWSAVGAHASLWDAIPSGPFQDRAAFADWLALRAESPAMALFTILDKTGAAPSPAGLLFLLRTDPEAGRTEIGLVFGQAITRRTAGTEAVFLLMRHVFETCGYRRLEWRCSPDNLASRRAAERFGFTYEGTLRENLWVEGAPWDTAIYAMLEREWAKAGGRMAAWLQPGNFDADGRQVRALETF
ncbi:GNAT family N-acetyltransferase [Phenylobacterium montanum]|uniref:GNAT family N-acetyltransferase n=1 Tax=Phenylobacterium montanum TaxID=2823693 RepID=A0A975FZN5_9CAUL|nr:GNAT family protein [Caulobacter sp. S6]QUD88116.1 GNAT family N-acetyltransferase [Caulobacter sp. S6]